MADLVGLRITNRIEMKRVNFVDDLPGFLENLVIGDRVSVSTQKQALNALAFFFKQVCGVEDPVFNVKLRKTGTRVPVVLPMRITGSLVRVLRKHHPLFLNTHFNHPDEITEQSAKACARLADAGIPLGNQSVLMRGINDDPEVMKRLGRSKW